MRSITICALCLLLVACSTGISESVVTATTDRSVPVSTLAPTLTKTSILTSTATHASIVEPSTPTKTSLPPTSTLRPRFGLFDYDKTVPLDVKWESKEQSGATVIHNLNYQSVDNCRVYAFLVTPAGNGPYPAVIYIHMGLAKKTQYLEEAKLLAERGVVSLLLDAPFVTKCGDDYIGGVINMRRGIDLLESLPEVDHENIGYVGHSYGATWGGVLAGVESRIKTYVLMAGYAQVSKKDSPDVPYLDAILYIGHAAAVSFLFQFSTRDKYISNDEALQYYNAANEPKKILWYDCTHTDLREAGQADRVNWLSEQLGFDYP